MMKSTCQLNRVTYVGILAVGMLLAGTHPAVADERNEGQAARPNDLASQLIGSWKLEEASTPGAPSGIGTRLKFFTGTHWSIVQPDPETGVIVFQHGGRYTVDGNKIKTTRDFAGESTKSMIGGTGTFTIEITGDTMKQSDANGVFNETWKRVKSLSE